MTRFCWRERTERVNWRMLHNLQLTDVVRRGDPTLLEPYTLHVTFAKLPVVVTSLRSSKSDIYENDGVEPSAGVRNAWFLVRVFQLAMEYLLFLRARDSTVVDSLREELDACQRECELLMERAKKWKDRAKSSDRQTDKLHHVLQSIAKLLQIEGATPSAVTTIEELLRDLVVARSGAALTKRRARPDRETQVEEARVCALCGKMFSSQEYLEKHTVRRHAGGDGRVAIERKPPRQAWTQPRDNNDGGGDAVVDPTTPVRGVKEMLRVVEQTLHEHQVSLRTVAQEEADKIHHLYEQLHVETQLADDMRAKRAAIEKLVEQSQQELDAIQQEKADAVEEIRVMKEQLQFLEMKRKIQAHNNGDGSANDTCLKNNDSTLPLELKRLESTIAMLKDALATSREELQRTQESYGALVKEKQRLEAQTSAGQKAPHLLVSEATQARVMKDVGSQVSVVVASTLCQTDDATATPPKPAASAPKHVDAAEAAVQTESRAAQVDGIVQTEPIGDPLVETIATEPTTSADVETPTEDDDNAIFKLHCRSISDAVERRALRYAEAPVGVLHGYETLQNDAKAIVCTRYAHASPIPSDDESNGKLFCSLPRRQFLRSRFLHDESAVKARIAAHVTKLEQTSLRYGVPPTSSVLANELVEVVQRALHAHLEVLPVEVLQRMIDVERHVNALIKSEWMPREKSRQQALEILTADRAVKNQRNELLIQQAMGALRSSGGENRVMESEASGPAKGMSAAVEGDQDKAATTPPSHAVAAQPKHDCVPHHEDVAVTALKLSVPIEEAANVTNSTVHQVVADCAPEPRQMPNLEITIDCPPLVTAKCEPDAVSYLVREPSPKAAPQAIAVRPVKVSASISVSARNSPPTASPLEAASATSLPRTASPAVRASSSPPPPQSSSPPSPHEKKATAQAASVASLLMTTTSSEPQRIGRDSDDDRRATSTARRSVVVSDMACSDVSLDASMPSLATDATSDAGMSTSQSFVKSSAEDLPTLQGDSDASPTHSAQLRSSGLEDDGTPELLDPRLTQCTQPVGDTVSHSHHNSPRPASLPGNEIMAFDDSDIEEVLLS